MHSFKIPFKLPSLNDYINACRRNKYAGASFKKKTEEPIVWILNTKRFVIDKPVRVTFVWHEPNKRRDKDNVAFAKKFILDALQKAGKLKNDNNQYIAGFNDDFVYGDEGVEVLINETNTNGRTNNRSSKESKER